MRSFVSVPLDIVLLCYNVYVFTWTTKKIKYFKDLVTVWTPEILTSLNFKSMCFFGLCLFNFYFPEVFSLTSEIWEAHKGSQKNKIKAVILSGYWTWLKLVQNAVARVYTMHIHHMTRYATVDQRGQLYNVEWTLEFFKIIYKARTGTHSIFHNYCTWSTSEGKEPQMTFAAKLIFIGFQS